MSPQRRPSDAVIVPFSQKTLANTLRDWLSQRGLTLYRVAALTRARYSGQNAYHIRGNLYFQLRSGLSPTFEQILALATVTSESVRDCLRIFGLYLDDIPRLQSVIARPRTTLIDKSLFDLHFLAPSFQYRQTPKTLATTTPLSQLLRETGSQPASALMGPTSENFLYAKMGTADRLTFPDLLPGSIVRANRDITRSHLPQSKEGPSGHIFLLRSVHGFFCARVRRVGLNRFAPVISDPALVTAPTMGTDLRILGVVDMEFRFRPISKREISQNSSSYVLSRTSPERELPLAQAPARPGTLLKHARVQAGLSFRAASEKTQQLATILQDPRYFASPGTLSDYEANSTLPRHVHKLFAVAAVYATRIADLLRSHGIEPGLPAFSNPDPIHPNGAAIPTMSFFEELATRYGEVPLFLAGALPLLTGLSHVSVRDVFWVGDSNRSHPALRGALFVVINRRSKRPRFDRRAPLIEQPIYLFQERNGAYGLGSCAQQRPGLFVYSATQQSPRTIRDAEVVGQVVAVARNLLGLI